MTDTRINNNDPKTAKAGEVITFINSDGRTMTVRLTGAPRYSEFHKRWYYPGYKFIMTSCKFSANSCLWS